MKARGARSFMTVTSRGISQLKVHGSEGRWVVQPVVSRTFKALPCGGRECISWTFGKPVTGPFKTKLEAIHAKKFLKTWRFSLKHRMSCPRCDAEMTLKRNNTTMSYFWGCSSFPQCGGSRNFSHVSACVVADGFDPFAHRNDGSEIFDTWYDEGHPFTDYSD